jgi:hypothetical protein
MHYALHHDVFCLLFCSVQADVEDNQDEESLKANVAKVRSSINNLSSRNLSQTPI